ncbi:predicted protein [Naegleria gruberi]|uniref:Predicted protein n=1 Tax=Naegleria gruberi TaxID=5762 RepID=D2V6Q3_NAEGR|nr:uncharacterized protein NAEGRDRAFT_47111 [Naegleria gruberi]EFC47619.1 predicted protein [Naegleria gruberi]|eukprot:XP_002680363.1 predicted protein [Naegleria gruberi strain NEG-M]
MTRHQSKESLVAELYYAANSFPSAHKFEVLVLDERHLYSSECLVSRPLSNHPSYNLKNYDRYSNDEIRYYSPIQIFLFDQCAKGSVLEISQIDFVDINSKNQIRAWQSTNIRSDCLGLERINRMLNNVTTHWITMDIKTLSNQKYDQLEITKSEMLVDLPIEIKYEIITFIPTYSKPERIKMMERNVKITCEQMGISQDEFYEKHCDDDCNTRLWEKKLNPACMKRVDNEFMTCVKMRLINREYALMMKKRILQLDTLYIYDDDFGERKYVRASLELSKREFMKNPLTDSLYIMHPKINRKDLCLTNYNKLRYIRCAPILNEISEVYSLNHFSAFGLKEVRIPLMNRIDFCDNRKELKIYRPTVMIQDLVDLRGLFEQKLDIYCLFVDARITLRFVEYFNNSESYQITLHKRDFCKRISYEEEGKPVIEVNLFELTEYHPLMFSQMTSEHSFYRLDLSNMKKMLDSIFKHGHSLFECYIPELHYFYTAFEAPTFLQPYTNYLRSTFQKYTLDFKPCLDFNFDPITKMEKYRAIDVLRNSLSFNKNNAEDYCIIILDKAWIIFKDNNNLRSYFFRPYLSFLNTYQLFSHITGDDFGIDCMEEEELAYQDEHGSTLLHQFASDKFDLDYEVVEEILECYPNLLSICNNEGQMPSEVSGAGQKFISHIMERNEIVVNEKWYRINPYEKPNKKQKRIDYFLNVK